MPEAAQVELKNVNEYKALARGVPALPIETQAAFAKASAAAATRRPHEVGHCRLSVSKSELKPRLNSSFDSRMS